MVNPSPAFATLMLALLCVIWGLTFPITRSIVTVADPMQYLALRLMIATAVLTPFAIRRLTTKTQRHKDVKLQIENCKLKIDSQQDGGAIGMRPPLTPPLLRRGGRIWMDGLLLGVLMFIGFTLQTIGMKYTTASRSGFFTGLIVVMTPIVAVLLKSSRMPRSSWLGVPLALAGIYLLADPSRGGLNLGDWLTIGCALTFAFQMTALESVMRRGHDVMVMAWMQSAAVMVGALVWSLVAALTEGNVWLTGSALFTLSPVGWLGLIYTGLFGGVVAIWMQTRFQPLVPAGHAALVFSLEPVFAGLFAWWLLGETWTQQGLLGAGLILGAMVLSSVAMGNRSQLNQPNRKAENSAEGL